VAVEIVTEACRRRHIPFQWERAHEGPNVSLQSGAVDLWPRLGDWPEKAQVPLYLRAIDHHQLLARDEARELPKRVRVRTSKYLNNGIEQDHRRVKHRIGAMVGLKSFFSAGVTITGIELTEKIRKGQFKIRKLGGSKATMPEIWRAALAFLTRDHYK
jgi:hypothetical protein